MRWLKEVERSWVGWSWEGLVLGALKGLRGLVLGQVVRVWVVLCVMCLGHCWTRVWHVQITDCKQQLRMTAL